MSVNNESRNRQFSFTQFPLDTLSHLNFSNEWGRREFVVLQNKIITFPKLLSPNVASLMLLLSLYR